MDNTRSGRCLQSKRVHMGHNIMPSLLLLFGGHGELIVLNSLVRLHLRNRLIANIKAQLFLTLGKPDPQSAPGAEPVAWTEEVLHFRTRVPRVQRVLVCVVCRHGGLRRLVGREEEGRKE